MLNQIESEKILREVPQLEQLAKSTSRGLHGWVLRGGKTRRQAADLLHGTWLGHPLHAVLTDLTIGAWVFSFVLDLFSLTNRSKGVERAADTLLDLGNVAGTTTAMAGLTDYSTIPHRAMASGATHGLLNAFGLTMSLLSSWNRKKGNRGLGIFLSSISSGILFFSAWLGGELAYKYKVGVNKIPQPPEPGKWHPTIPEQDLPDMTPKRVEVEGSPILLYRYQDQIYAIGAVCGHDGGALDEGSFDGYCVTCPLHQSVYDLRDGSVVHGPSTYAEPVYEVRVQDGTVEVRLGERPAMEQTTDIVQEDAKAIAPA